MLRGLFAVFALLVLVYLPGLNGDFVFDDEPNITRNKDVLITDLSWSSLRSAAFSSAAGPLQRPIPMVSFALNHRFTGLDPFWFKATNIAIHITNGALVFLLTTLLLRTPALSRVNGPEREDYTGWCALVVAALWVLHPLQLTSVLYVVQRMNSLCATFVLCGVCAYLQIRLRMLVEPGGGMWLFCATVLFGMFAILSKENGALLPLYCLVVELTLLRYKTKMVSQATIIALYHMLFCAVPAMTLTAWLCWHSDWFETAFAGQPFSAFERLLTQARVLFIYLSLLISPSLSSLGLYHDDIVISHNIFSPLSTLFAALGWLALVGVGWWQRSRYPTFTFAIMWYLIGHSMESSILPLELMHEHRNYLPSIGPVFAIVYATSGTWSSLASTSWRSALAIAALSLLAAVTATRSEQWRDPVRHALLESTYHPGSARAQYDLGRIYGIAYINHGDREDRKRAMEQFWKAAQLNEYHQIGMFAMLMLDYHDKRPADAKVLAALASRLRQHPLRLSDLAGLKELVRCAQAAECVVPLNDMQVIVYAALSHPNLHANAIVSLLEMAAEYSANTLGDFDTAEEFLKKALALNSGDAMDYLNLVELYLAMGKSERAEESLRMAEELDVRERYGQQIAGYRQRLNQHP